MKAYFFARSANAEMLKYADESAVKEAFGMGEWVYATCSRAEAVRYLVEQRNYPAAKAEQMVGAAESNPSPDWVRV